MSQIWHPILHFGYKFLNITAEIELKVLFENILSEYIKVVKIFLKKLITPKYKKCWTFKFGKKNYMSFFSREKTEISKKCKNKEKCLN